MLLYAGLKANETGSLWMALSGDVRVSTVM